jgi:hypothetical protein
MHRTAIIVSLMLTACGLALMAQAPAATPDAQVPANLNQLMRGAFYPPANVVFFAQADNPAEIKFVPGHDPNMSTDPLTSTFGGWQAVENAALTLAESASLLSVPGRVCSTGVPVPVTHPDWIKFVNDVREAGLKAYAAAKAKDQDKIIEVADPLNASCTGCHRRFRDRRAPATRCTP